VVIAPENMITLDQDIAPLTAASVMQTQQNAHHRLMIRISSGLPPTRFLTEEAFTEATFLYRTNSSGDRNNCLLNSAAQALTLLEPTQAFKSRVLDVIELWRCHLHAQLMPRFARAQLDDWVQFPAGVTSTARCQRSAANVLFTHAFQGTPHLHMLANYFDRPVIVMQWVGHGTEQPGFDCEPFPALFCYEPGWQSERVLNRKEATLLANKGVNGVHPIFLRLQNGHFEPLLKPQQRVPLTGNPWPEQWRRCMLASLEAALRPPLQCDTLTALTWSPQNHHIQKQTTKQRAWELLKIGWQLMHTPQIAGDITELWIANVMPRVLPHM
jgi:hypothetical protein